MSTFIRKAVAGISSLAMVASMVMVPASATAATAGGVYKTSDGTVWFVTSDMQRRPFTSGGAFLSYGFLSFSQVVDADASVTALPQGAFIAPADGKIFCATETKGSDVAGECSLITGGQKAAFTSAAVFTGLGFSFSRAMYGDSSFLSKTTNIDNTSSAHRAGVLVNNGGTVQMIVNGGLWGIPSIEVFNSWGYSFADVVPANAADKTMTQIGVIPSRVAGQLVPTGTTAPGPVSGLSASVASSSPAASTLVAGQATAHLADFMINGSGNIGSITLKRIGVSEDATLSNVYLFDGAVRLTDAASVSGGNITFAGLNIPLSGSKVLSVKSDIMTGTSGQTVGVQLTAVNGTTLSSQPSGAIHTIATATLATVSVGAPTASGATDPQNDINVWESTFNVGVRDVVFSRMALRQVQNINNSDVNNFRLFVDGTQVASQQSLDSNGYVTFSGFSKNMAVGNRNVKVIANIIGGSSRSIQMSLRNKADLDLRDSQYNVNISASGTFPASPTATSINSGNMTVVKASNSPSGSVTVDASSVVLGRWTFSAFGEPIKVETLLVDFTYDGSPGATNNAAATLRNGRVLVNGSQVGSTTTLNPASTGTSFTTNFTVNPGTPATVEVVSDIFDNDGTGVIDAGDTIIATLSAGSSNATRQVSLGTIGVPSSSINANQLTVAVGSLSMAKTSTYSNQTVVAPVSAFKIASFQIAGNSTEDVNVHTISADIAVTDNGANSPDITDVNDVYFMINGTTQTSVKPTVSATNNSYSVTFTVPKNGTVSLDMFASLNSEFASTDTVVATVTVTGTTVSSGTSVNTGAIAGQTITVGSGSVSLAFENSSAVAARLIPDQQSDVTTSAYRLSTLNDSQTLQDLTVTITSATTVNAVKVYAGGVLKATKPGGTSVSFSDLGIPVAANSSVLIEIKLDIGTVTNTTGLAAVTTSITAATAAPGSTGVEASVTPSGTGNLMYVFAATPVITQLALPNTTLANGVQTIAKFTMSGNGGTVNWKALNLAISKTTTITGSAVQLFRDGALVATGAETIAAGTTDTVNIVTDNEESVSGTVTYEVRATLALVDADDFFTTTLSAAETAQESAAYASVADSNFVWSDVVGSASAVHSVTSTDWHNDFLVITSPMSWTMSN